MVGIRTRHDAVEVDEADAGEGVEAGLGVPERSASGSELLVRVAEVEAAIDALRAVEVAGADVAQLGDATVRLHRVRDRLEAHVARAGAAAWAAGVGVESSVNTPAWLTKQTGSSRKAVVRSLRLGRELVGLAVVQAAWEAGELSTAKVERIAAAANPRTRKQLTADQTFLVGWARQLAYFEVDRMMSVWSLHADPDGPEQRHDKRNVWLTESVDGMFLGKMSLDPVSGTIVWLELVRLEQELFDADWAEARQRLGRAPRADELGRTSGQRRADAMVEMARRSAAMPADARMPRVLFSVLVGEGPFRDLCELEATRQPIPVGAVRDWLDDAVFERILFAAADRVLSVSERRDFPAAIRRAVQVRDRSCAGDDGACGVGALFSHIDHVNPAALGGATSEANAESACGPHNLAKGITIGERLRRDADRYLHWITDPGRTSDTGPDPPAPP